VTLLEGSHSTTLRLALGLRGGVSLAVWIGGAVAELDDLRRADPAAAHYYDRLLAVGRYSSVEIDVMSGASAGGLNAVLAAAAMVGGAEVGDMRETWLGVAGLRDLLESKVGHDAQRRSLLGGDFFYEHILSKVSELIGKNPTDGDRPDHLGHRIDIFLSATVLGGMPVSIEDDQYSPDRAKRSGAVFHFRHFAPDEAVSDLVGAEADKRLAKAARTTASFPTAFDPVEFEPDEMPGVLLLPAAATNNFRMLDGGVVDNIPVARALNGVPNIPSRTATDRWLMYLQPSPDSLAPVTGAARATASAAGDTSPGLLAVVLGIVGAFMSESILDDVEVLRRHNLDAIDEWQAWSAAAGPLPDVPVVAAPDAVIDAERLVALLLSPADELVWQPLHQAVPAGPIAALSAAAQSQFRERVETLVRASAGPLRPFAAIARTAALLTRWARIAETGLAPADGSTNHVRATISTVKLTAYQLMHLAQLLTAGADWHVLQHLGPPADPDDAVGRLQDFAAALNGDEAINTLALALPIGDLDLAGEVGDATHGDLLRQLHACAYAPSPMPARSPSPSPVDVVETMWSRLGKLAVELSRISITDQADDSDPIFAELAKAIAARPADAPRFMQLIDARTVGVHHGRASATPRTFKYLRMAGSNLSPMCEPPSALAYDGPRFTSAELVRPTGDDTVAANMKLAGSDLGNFSAFISQRWRANDWMWGRLDAAKSIVDLVTSADRLGPDPDATYRAIETLMTSSFQLEPAVDAAWGAELRDAAAELWERHRDEVRRELAQENRKLDANDRLRLTKSILVLRRHWEIVANELPVVQGAELRPGKVDASAPTATPTKPTGTLAAALADYERSPRSFGQVWGTRWLTALGIRTAYAFWAATSPRSAMKRVLRTPLKPLPMTALGIALARNRGLMAIAISYNLILMPRLNGIGAWMVFAAGAILAIVLGKVFAASTSKGRAVPLEKHGGTYRLVTVAMFACGAAINGVPGLRTWLYKTPLLDRATAINVHVITPYSIAAFVAGGLTSWLLWCWAKRLWRLASALFVAEITFLWTVFSRIPLPIHPSHLQKVAFNFGSIGWALLIAIMMPTTVAHWAFHTGIEITEYRAD
jgi:patatin-related protein